MSRKQPFTEEEFFDQMATTKRIIERQIRDEREEYCKKNLRRILNIYDKVGKEQKRYIASKGRLGKEVLLKKYLKPKDLMCLEKYHKQQTKSTPIHTFELDDDDYDAKPVPLSPIVEELKKQIKKHGPDNKKRPFDKSFRKISMEPGACRANRKKSTTRKKRRRRRRRRKGRITFGGKRRNRKKRTRKYKKRKTRK